MKVDNEVLSQCIKELQQSHCLNCKVGKAVMALTAIKEDDPDPAAEAAAPDDGKTGSKACKVCGVPKTLRDFPVAKNCKDGHAATCKKCKCDQARDRRHQQQTTLTPDSHDLRGVKKHICPDCGKAFLELFSLQAHRSLKHGVAEPGEGEL